MRPSTVRMLCGVWILASSVLGIVLIVANFELTSSITLLLLSPFLIGIGAGVFCSWTGSLMAEEEARQDEFDAIRRKYGVRDLPTIEVIQLLESRGRMEEIFHGVSLSVAREGEAPRYPKLENIEVTGLGVVADFTLPQSIDFKSFEHKLARSGNIFETAYYTNVSSAAIGRARIEVRTRQPGEDDLTLDHLPSPTSEQVFFAESWTGTPVGFSPFQHHTLVTGVTRSGKSRALMAILMQVTEMPTPVTVCGIDPSYGLLTPFASQPDITLGTSKESLLKFGETLDRVTSELDRRFNLFLELRRSKIEVGDLSDELPAILIVIEELQSFIDGLNDLPKASKAKITRDLSRILREGSKGMVHVLAVQQRAEAKIVEDRAQYSRRIVFRQDNTDGAKMALPAASSSQVETLLEMKPGRAFLLEPGHDVTGLTTPDFDEATYFEVIARNLRENPHA